MAAAAQVVITLQGESQNHGFSFSFQSTQVWLDCRDQDGRILDIQNPEAVLSQLQGLVAEKQKVYKQRLDEELLGLENRFDCLRHEDEFALQVAEREVRLPAPLETHDRQKDVWVLPLKDLDDTVGGMTGDSMQGDLLKRSGLQLIVITKPVPTDAAHQQYACIAKSQLPLISWAKIRPKEEVTSVAFLAILVDEGLKPHAFKDLQTLQQPLARDIAAQLDITVSTDSPKMTQALMSLRLSIRQDQCTASTKVCSAHARSCNFIPHSTGRIVASLLALYYVSCALLPG